MNGNTKKMLDFMPPKIRAVFLLNIKKQNKYNLIDSNGYDGGMRHMINKIEWAITSQGWEFWNAVCEKLVDEYEVYKSRKRAANPIRSCQLG